MITHIDRINFIFYYNKTTPETYDFFHYLTHTTCHPASNGLIEDINLYLWRLLPIQINSYICIFPVNDIYLPAIPIVIHSTPQLYKYLRYPAHYLPSRVKWFHWTSQLWGLVVNTSQFIGAEVIPVIDYPPSWMES